MLLRKTNAVLSLICTILLLFHAIFQAVMMFTAGNIGNVAKFMSWGLLGLMLLHALICIDLGISAHENAEKRKNREYPKLNIPTFIQRISGILLIVFAILHVTGATGIMTPPKAVHAIVPPLFFALSLLHAAVSTSKAFITLGIGNAKAVKIADVAVKVVCGLTLIADVVGFYLYRC